MARDVTTTTPATLAEFEPRAREILPRQIYDYGAGASGSETSKRRNREALDRLALEQRVLVDVREIDTSIDLLGLHLPSPVLVAPMGGLFNFHPEGDREMVRGAGQHGNMAVVSGVAGWTVEEVAAAARAPLMFQIYHHGNRDWAAEYLPRVQRAGYPLLCLTVDTAVYSRRERDLRNGFMARSRRRPDIPTDLDYQARLTWADARWVRELLSGPLGLKGILHPDDARRAIDEGLDFVWVSNHGGRQLDDTRGTMDALPEIAEAVGGRVPIIVDGGFERGTDVLKALALGATAVAVGRTILWGLAIAGAAGVGAALGILNQEMQIALALSGHPSIRHLCPADVRLAE